MWHRGRGRSRGMPRGGNWGSRGGGRGNFNRGGRSRGSYDNFRRINDKSFHNDINRQTINIIEKLHEVDIGVTEYISNLKGFSGILKSRYSDFHVNEIDLDGKEAKLTDLQVPKDPEPVTEEEDDDNVVNRYRMEQLPIETWDRIHKMVQTKNENEVVEIDVTKMTKEDRTKIHEAVKTVFGQKVVGSTITKDNNKYVVIKLFNKNERYDPREKWPKTREGEYVYFLVYKEYTDTIEANIQISDCLQIKPSYFNYAGVKDRRAKTTQWFCARKLEPKKIAERTKYLRNIKVGNYCYKKDSLKLGQLKGNRFRIALRNITAENDILENALQSLKETGFINYYGLQRFGNCKDIPTHEIGLQLLRGNWKGAVELILKPRKYEQDRDIGNAKQIYEETSDVNKAYDMLGKKRNRCIEGKLLGGMVRHSPKDYVNALENVPRNMRLLYLHAYQSLVWNKIVSKRIKEFGLKPIVGDLVVEGNIEEMLPFLEANEEVSLHNINHVNAMERVIQEKGTYPPRLKVKVLTEIDLPNHTIYDIVLPLPGYDITYPNNKVKQWYEEILTEGGLSLEMPKQRVKTYTLSGAYRKLIEKVENLSWKIMGYSDLTFNLIRSDYEELLQIPEPKDIPDAKYKALILDFCLPSSCYATMVLREIMKIDTSVETHMNLDKSTQTASSSNTEQNQTIKQEIVDENLTSNMDDDLNKCIKQEIVDENFTSNMSDDLNRCIKKEIEENEEIIDRVYDTNQIHDKRKLQTDNEVVEYKKIKTEESLTAFI